MVGAAALALSSCEKPVEPAATYTADGKLLRPDPTDWVLISSSASAIAPMGHGGDAMMAGGDSMMAEDSPQQEESKAPEGKFNIIRIDPAAWKAYQETGKFPEGTVFVTSFYSMNDKDMGADRFWADQPIGMEAGVKDNKRFEDGWAYFRFEGDAMEAEVLPKERCFQCHQERGAEDNVFTQLYLAFNQKK